MNIIESRDFILEKTWKDTISLLEKARDYALREARFPSTERSPLETIRASSEMLKVTTRLTEAMAWILAQKAVKRGEISEQEAASEYFMPTNNPIWTEETSEEIMNSLPGPLQSLTWESRNLYCRVSRLASANRQKTEAIMH